VWGAIKAVITKLWGVIVAAFKLSPVGIIASHWAKIRSGVSAAWSGIVSAVRGFWSKVTGVFSTAYSKFLGIGSAIVSGIRSGISGAWGQFESWFKGLIGKPVQWAKDILHIGSPSRVFAEIGGYVAEGLAVGIRGGEGAVRRASQDLAGSTMPAFGGRRSYAVGVAGGGRGAVLNVLPGAVSISFGAGAVAGGVSQASVDATVDRAFRRLAAELGRR
jgi:hypothetical protein